MLEGDWDRARETVTYGLLSSPGFVEIKAENRDTQGKWGEIMQPVLRPRSPGSSICATGSSWYPNIKDMQIAPGPLDLLDDMKCWRLKINAETRGLAVWKWTSYLDAEAIALRPATGQVVQVRIRTDLQTPRIDFSG